MYGGHHSYAHHHGHHNYGRPREHIQQRHSGYGGSYGSPPPNAYGGPPPPPAPYGYGAPPPPPQPYGYGGGYGGYPPQQPYPYPPHSQPYPSPSHSYPHQPLPPQPYGQPGGHYGSTRAVPPSTSPQLFGHGAPDQYSFQYSACNGRRKALLIGINYYGQQGELKGCINDVKNVSEHLVNAFGYKPEDMVKLTDDQPNPACHPTKANMIRAMQWLVKDARPNDSLFFHYSGHGGQTPDLDGDEEDGSDEVIYPVDYRQAGHIVDDELHSILVGPLVAGVRLTAIFDSCHSGSALDLPYVYNTQGMLKEPNLAKEAGTGLLSAVMSYARGDRSEAISNGLSQGLDLFKKITKGPGAREKTQRTKTSPADVIMWSGSKDDQTSADASQNGAPTGAMSWAFLTALKKNPQQSYVQLLNSIRDELAGKYDQKPQLSCCHPLDTDLLYVM